MTTHPQSGYPCRPQIAHPIDSTERSSDPTLAVLFDDGHRRGTKLAAFATTYREQGHTAHAYTYKQHGLGVLIYAHVTDFSLALIIQFLLGLLVAAVNVASDPLLFSITPKALLGRVMALANPFFALCSLFAIGLAGYFASTVRHTLHISIISMTIGPIDTIFFGAGVVATCGGLYAIVNLRTGKSSVP